ncbi:hypothetical protein GCM10010264_43820 [Streptomyces globisporus]|nr:hypothetical protein GCM10010264_43820 [Streptomyces globisporus]
MHDEPGVDTVHPAVGRGQIMGVGVAADAVVRLVERHLMNVVENVGGGQSRHSGPHHGRAPPFPCHPGSLRFFRLVGALLERPSSGIRG